MSSEKSKKIIFDYSKASVTNKYAVSIDSSGNYIKVPFTSSGSDTTPNLITYLPESSKYKVNNLFIFRNIHKVKDFDYDGELIIEHIPITNDTGKKVYTCFLLKTKSTSGTPTVIDKIINRSMGTSQVLNMNDLLETKPQCIRNKKGNVFIFTTPIQINSKFSDFGKEIEDKLFQEYISSDYDDIDAKDVNSQVESFTEGFVEGNMSMGDKGYLECTPTGVSEKTIEMYNVKLTGDLITKQSKVDVMRTTINFFVFMIIVGAAACISPFLYKSFIVQIVKDSTGVVDSDKAGSLKLFDLILIVIFVTMTITICTDGINADNPAQTSTGVMLFLFILLSISVISYLKMSDPAGYGLAVDDQNTGFNFAFLSVLLGFVMSNYTDIAVIYVMFSVLLTVFVLAMFYTKALSKNRKQNEKARDIIFGIGYSYGLIISIYIGYIFSLKK